jgi:glycosyltransferase involved in cell wall biosynthesis
MKERSRICLIASSRFPVAEPFAGGLEAHTHALARELIARGHEVSLFAAAGSDGSLNLTALPVAGFQPSAAARLDVGASPDQWMREHHAYLALMLELSRSGANRFDVIHNNSLHHLPLAMAGALAVPLITTLHTPPTAWLESAIALAPATAAFAAVSEHTARAWAGSVATTVIRNGVDLDRWYAGPGGTDAIWFGRLVPEKGAHLAIRAARRAGVRILLAGPIFDAGYFAEAIAPELDDEVSYLGHLGHDELRAAIGRSAVAVVSPRWDEPYGLVAAEALACGTPVAAFARGALPEIVDDSCGRLAPPDDVDALAAAIDQARRLPRADARAHAVATCSLDRMVDEYEQLYTDMQSDRRAA